LTHLKNGGERAATASLVGNWKVIYDLRGRKSLVANGTEWARGLLKRMAIAWTNLAEQAENGPQQSIVQQQRQSQPKGIDFDRLTPEEQRRMLDG